MSNEKQELTEAEKSLFKAIDANDVGRVKQLLTEIRNVNVTDQDLMTPLQYAAYRGNKDIVQILLDHGADVNMCEHKHNYTALHFAALSGNTDVCTALLLAGAKPSVTNTVGRTPTQMAAFVGNHACVTLINNFVSKEEVDEFTKAASSKLTPLLPKHVAESFHKFIMQVNIHPVRVALNLQNFIGLKDHLESIHAVLEAMTKAQIKHVSERNEVIAFKYHYIAYIVKEMLKISSKQQTEKKDDKKNDPVELFARKLLRPGKDGNLDYMDSFLRECVREFPYRDCTIFRQVVATLAGKDPPPALHVITSAINGQRGFVEDVTTCSSCGEEKPAKKCSKCKVVQYCDRNCQRLHWPVHKKTCDRLGQVGPGGDAQRVRPDVEELQEEIKNLMTN